MITRNHIRRPLEFVRRKGDTEMTIIAIICLGLLMGVAASEANAA
jgi:hypothetical protein